MDDEQQGNTAYDAEARQRLTFGHLDRMSDPLQFAAASPEGRAWIAELPNLADRMCRGWGLELEYGAIHTGYHAVVLPVSRHGEPLVLKLTWPVDRIVDEARALAAWQGSGAVRIFDADSSAGAILLERLDPRRTLLDLDPIDAAAVAGRLLRRLAIPAPRGFRDLRALAGDIRRSLNARQERLGSPIPNGWLREALTLSRHLEQHAGNDLLIHADLHHDNVLAGTREPWLAIDPKPVAGEPEHAVPELMWTRVDEVEGEQGIRRMLVTLVESGALDPKRARSWVIVRCVDYWLWGLEHGLTEDPKRCQAVLQAIV